MAFLPGAIDKNGRRIKINRKRVGGFLGKDNDFLGFGGQGMEGFAGMPGDGIHALNSRLGIGVGADH